MARKRNGKRLGNFCGCHGFFAEVVIFEINSRFLEIAE